MKRRGGADAGAAAAARAAPVEDCGQTYKRHRRGATLPYTDRFEIRPSTLGRGAGNGLFTKVAIQKGEVLVALEDPVHLTPEEWAAFKVGKTYPPGCIVDDTCICVERSKGCSLVVDRKAVHELPYWYIMNHQSRDPNCVFLAKGGTVVWKALKDIGKGVELFYNYGRPDASWVAPARSVGRRER